MVKPVLVRLAEVGRVLSKKNETALRAALDALSKVLSALDSEESVDEADRSFRDIQNRLFKAIRIKMAAQSASGETRYAYICDVFPDSVVWEVAGEYYQAPYTIGENGDVVIGDEKAVIPRTVYEPAIAESADASGASILTSECVPLLEAETTTIREAAAATVKIIQPGWGSSGYYPADVLRRDGPGVFAQGLKMYWDHPTAQEESARPEGSLRRLAGELTSNAYFDEAGPAGPGLYATAKVFDSYKADVLDMAPHIGLSIRAAGTLKQGEAEGRKGPIVEKIVAAKSVDFVTTPGAGGKILQLFESAVRRHVDSTPAASRCESNQEQPMTPEQQRALTEAQEAAKANAEKLLKVQQALRESHARVYAMEKLGMSDLPKQAQSRLLETLTASAPSSADGELDAAKFAVMIDEAIKAEAAYIASVTNIGKPKGLGAQIAEDPKLQESVTASRATLDAQLARLGIRMPTPQDKTAATAAKGA